MAEIDIVIPGLKIIKEGVFNLKEVYNLINEFLCQRGYDLTEKEQMYNEEGKLKIKYEADKKADDYTKFIIEITITGAGTKEVELKNKKASSGKFSIKIEAKLKKDYEDTWDKRPFQKFMREIFDKFVLGSKFDRYSKELTDEAYALYNELKSYIGLKV